MTRSSTDSMDGEYLLRRLLSDFGGEIAPPRWVWDVDRWRELAFSILTQATAVPEPQLRKLVIDLDALGLLELDALADVARDEQSGTSDVIRKHAIEVMIGHGVPEADAFRAFVGISRTASALQTIGDGSLQGFLRRHGEAMLAELNAVLGKTGLSEVEQQAAITYWLQNTLNLPISLVDDSMGQFCTANDLSTVELIEAGERIGLDLGVIDDLTQRWAAARGGTADAQ